MNQDQAIKDSLSGRTILKANRARKSVNCQSGSGSGDHMQQDTPQMIEVKEIIAKKTWMGLTKASQNTPQMALVKAQIQTYQNNKKMEYEEMDVDTDPLW